MKKTEIININMLYKLKTFLSHNEGFLGNQFIFGNYWLVPPEILTQIVKTLKRHKQLKKQYKRLLNDFTKKI